MKDYLAITKALSDQTRVRALVCLRGGELCVCQIIRVLRLSPATVSKHMSILYQADLVERRKDGRWHYYRLAGRGAPPLVRRAIKWTFDSLAHQKAVAGDARALCCVRRADRKEMTGCYSAD